MVSEVSHFEHSIHVHSDQSAGIDIQLPKHFVQLMTGRLPLLGLFYAHGRQAHGQVTTEQFVTRCDALACRTTRQRQSWRVRPGCERAPQLGRLHSHAPALAAANPHSDGSHRRRLQPIGTVARSLVLLECDGEASPPGQVQLRDGVAAQVHLSGRLSLASSRINLQLTGQAPPPPLSDRALSAVPGSRRSSQLSGRAAARRWTRSTGCTSP